MPRRDDWAEAASCTWLHEAQLIVSVLEAAGIAAAIPNEHTLGVQPLYANLVGGVRVMVHGEDLARAREILASTEPPPQAEQSRRRGAPVTAVAAHYDSHLAPIYLWMAGGIEQALTSGAGDIEGLACPGGLAVDLGAGFGMHAIPLARSWLPGGGHRLLRHSCSSSCETSARGCRSRRCSRTC